MSVILPEIAELLSWMGDPPRSPAQTHGLNESDSEVIDLGNGTYLAATVDTVSEEIAAGLYRDPYRIGWVTAMASLSDLAAVGARPLGLLLSAEWGEAFDTAAKAEIARGFSEALRRCGTYWLGGDTGRSRATVLGGVGLGLCASRPLSRVGARPGDVICMTGTLGDGPSLAIRFLLGQGAEAFDERHFQPVARVDAGQALRGIATSAMDTSDGLVSTLGTLMALNQAVFELEWNDAIFSGAARRYCAAQELPLWALWEVEHGDYQLVVTVPPERLGEAKALVPDLHRIGRVVAGGAPVVRLPDGRGEPFDPGLARRLLEESGRDLTEALRKLIRHARQRRLP